MVQAIPAVAGAIFGGGGAGDVAKTVAGAAIPALLGSGRKKVKREVTQQYPEVYERDPYAWQPGEETTYQASLDEILRRQRQREFEEQGQYAEAINRRGLGASSIYGTGRARISQTAQQALQSQNVARMMGLQRTREARARQQTGYKQQWMTGVSAPAQLERQRAQERADVAGQQTLMGQIAQNIGTQTYDEPYGEQKRVGGGPVKPPAAQATRPY